jgi:hypothetical protein
MTQSGIEPATFRFVTQQLNHCATAATQIFFVYSSETLITHHYSTLRHVQEDLNREIISHLQTYECIQFFIFLSPFSLQCSNNFFLVSGLVSSLTLLWSFLLLLLYYCVIIFLI